MARHRNVDHYLPPDDSVGIADRPEPMVDAPRPVGIHFGCQLGWGPDRENATVDLPVDLPDGRTITVMVCPVCGSGVGGEVLARREVCAGCLRYSEDATVERILSQQGIPDPEPSKPVYVPGGKGSITVSSAYLDRMPG